MASFRVDGFDEAIKRLNKLSDRAKIEAIARHAVDEAKSTVISNTKGSLQSVIKTSESTGSLVGSIQGTATKTNSYGAYTVIKPTGRNKKGVSNAKIAAFLEYGTSRGVTGQHWRSKAVAASEAKAKQIIEGVLEKEMQLE